MAQFVAFIDRSIGAVSVSVNIQITAPGEAGEAREALVAGILIGYLRHEIEASIARVQLITLAREGDPDAAP